VPLRVKEEQEALGLDLSQHGESVTYRHRDRSDLQLYG
jgi:ammonia channel protein AmtB